MHVYDLRGREAIVIGGARGLGYAIAERMLQSGGSVSLWDVEEIAALVCWLATEECSFSTGAVFDISGGRATY
jgi:NAD(P)-dependent dehydrogenase (short-subunit alcohol dehydrogenase family)